MVDITQNGVNMVTEAKNKPISQKNKVFRIVNYCLMILLTLTCIGLCIYYFIIGDPNNRVLASIGVAILFILPILIELIFRCRISNLIILCYIIYSVLAGLLGCVFNFYNLTSLSLNVWYDIFIHGLAGYVFCFVGLILISRLENYKKLSPWTILFFCLFLSLAVELIWELMEWFADSCLGQNSQGFPPEGQPAPLVTDTNIDLLCNFTGVILFAIHFIIGKFTKVKLGFNYIEDELCGNKVVVRNNKKKEKVDIQLEENSLEEQREENISEFEDNPENQEINKENT